MKFTYINENACKIIKNYTIKDNSIIIHLLNDEIIIKPYSKEQEEAILDEMLEQAYVCLEQTNISKLNKTYEKLVPFSHLHLKPMTKKCINLKEKIEKYEKYKIYLENIDKFECTPLNIILNGIPKRTDNININTLDSYTYDEIRQMYTNIIIYLHTYISSEEKKNKGKNITMGE